MATPRKCPACALRARYTGMIREAPARYRVSFRCDCGHAWSELVTAEEAHRLRSPTPPGVPIAAGTKNEHVPLSPEAENLLKEGLADAKSGRIRPLELMRLVFLSAPVRPIQGETVESNLARAQHAYKQLSLAHPNIAFQIPWLVNCAVFEETPENIAVGMRRNKAVIDRCDELWLVGNRLSTGMKEEAEYARSMKKIVMTVGWSRFDPQPWSGGPDGHGLGKAG